MQLKLVHRAILFTLTALILEGLLAFELGYKLSLSQSEIESHIRSREIVANLSTLSGDFRDAVMALTHFRLSKNDQDLAKYRSKRLELSRALASLTEIPSDSQSRRQLIAKIRSRVKNGLSALDDTNLSGSGDPELAPFEERMVIRQTRSLADWLEEELQEFRQLEMSEVEAGKKLLESFKFQLQGMVIFSVILTLALMVATVLFFRNAIERRLSKMIDNTRRFVSGVALHPPLGGNDEISDLDSTFHEMVKVIESAQRQMNVMIDCAPAAILSIDADNKITTANSAADKLFCRPPGSLIGERLVQLLDGESLDLTISELCELREKEDQKTFETRLKVNSSVVEVSWSAQWSRSENSLFCVVHDISERKQLEQMKRDFINMVTHDLRSPLTSLSVFLSVFERDADEKHSRRIQLAHSSVERLIKLIGDLLDVEKLQSGGFTLEISAVDVNELIKNIRDNLSGMSEKFGVNVVLDKTCQPTIAKADEDKITRVLENLLSNAIKYSPRGSTVTIRVENDGKIACISIQDQGPGIPEEQREKIFDKFHQVRSGDSKKGTGLGLAIAREIVECHGGWIGVISGRGEGSIFWFTLPVQS
jgi:PAS domain S-box-containing protein